MTFLICLGSLHAFPSAIKVASEHLTILLPELSCFRVAKLDRNGGKISLRAEKGVEPKFLRSYGSNPVTKG